MDVGTGRDAYAETAAAEHAVVLKHALGTIRRRLGLIALVAILVTGLAAGYSLLQTPQYEASIKLLVGREGGISENPQDVLGLQQLALTMAEAVVSRPVAEDVIQQLGLRTDSEEVLENLSVELIPDTQFIQVSYTDADPERAKRIVNTTGAVFSQRVGNVSESASAITANVWESAVTPSAPVSPDPLRNSVLAMFLGIFVGLGLAFLLEYLDDSWQSPEEAELISGVPTLGIVPEFNLAQAKNKREG